MYVTVPAQVCFSFASYHSWTSVHNVNHKYCIHPLLSTRENPFGSLNSQWRTWIILLEVLFLCTLYYINFLTRSRQPIHNGWMDAAQFFKLFDPAEEVLQCPRGSCTHWEVTEFVSDTARRDFQGSVSHIKRVKKIKARVLFPHTAHPEENIFWSPSWWPGMRVGRTSCSGADLRPLRSVHPIGICSTKEALCSVIHFIYLDIWLECSIWQLLRPESVAWIQNFHKAFSELVPNWIQHMLGEEIEPWLSELSGRWAITWTHCTVEKGAEKTSACLHIQNLKNHKSK